MGSLWGVDLICNIQVGQGQHQEMLSKFMGNTGEICSILWGISFFFSLDLASSLQPNYW